MKESGKAFSDVATRLKKEKINIVEEMAKTKSEYDNSRYLEPAVAMTLGHISSTAVIVYQICRLPIPHVGCAVCRFDPIESIRPTVPGFSVRISFKKRKPVSTASFIGLDDVLITQVRVRDNLPAVSLPAVICQGTFFGCGMLKLAPFRCDD